MRLVNDDILEAELLQGGFLNETNFVRRDADVEVLREETSSDEIGTLFLGTREYDSVDIWRPLLELARPVLERRLRNDDEMRAGYVGLVFEVGEEGDRLKCFSEAL